MPKSNPETRRLVEAAVFCGFCLTSHRSTTVPHQVFSQDRCPSSYLTNSATLKIIYKTSHNNCEKCKQCFFQMYTTQKVIARFLVRKITIRILPSTHTSALTVRKFWSAFYPLTVRRSASPHFTCASYCPFRNIYAENVDNANRTPKIYGNGFCLSA